MSVVIVTFNSDRVIASCLESIGRQTHSPLEVLVIDNDSGDGTEDAVRSASLRLRWVKNETNLGFAAAHNQGIRLTRGEFYLALNPDVEMSPSFVEELVKALELDSTAGSVSGKLLRPASGAGPQAIDSTGIYMTPSLRHLDRGSGEPDTGQYGRMQYVFGASGAAAMYRRLMLEDIALLGETFDEDFFAYREDADLAWRAQLLGWKALYAPKAVAIHERRVLPERRGSLPPEINMHSVKNRFMLRLKNQTPVEFLVLLLPSIIRDLQVLGYVMLVETSSLPGLTFVIRNFSRIWAKRKRIMFMKKVSGREMLKWFRSQPVAFDLEDFS